MANVASCDCDLFPFLLRGKDFFFLFIEDIENYATGFCFVGRRRKSPIDRKKDVEIASKNQGDIKVAINQIPTKV